MTMTGLFLLVVVLASGGIWVGREVRAWRNDMVLQQLLRTFAPAVERAGHDPRALLAWHPLMMTARHLFGPAFARLDRAHGKPFPFAPELTEQAHARWTADWLAWEGAHDRRYKKKAAALEAKLGGSALPRSALIRAQLDALQQEKLERYQTRYQEYVRISKALAGLLPPDTSHPRRHPP